MACTYSIRRVAWPTARTRTPVASGSRVPACPIFVLRGNHRAARSSASRDVMPGGLSRTRRPWGLIHTGNANGPGRFASNRRGRRCTFRLLILLLVLGARPDLGQEADRLPLGRQLHLQALSALDGEPHGVRLVAAL